MTGYHPHGGYQLFREAKIQGSIGWAGIPEMVVALGEDVPMEIASMADWPAAQRIAEGQRWAPAIATWGDSLQYRGNNGDRAYRGLVIGLACASYMPGGIGFAGMHWESGPENTATQAEEVA